MFPPWSRPALRAEPGASAPAGRQPAPQIPATRDGRNRCPTIHAADTAEAGNVSIQVLDVTGKVYFTQNANASVGNNAFGIALDGIESGVYFVQIKNGDKQLIDKFIVTK